MATPYLHGNGTPCTKCNATGRQLPGISQTIWPCKTCKGTGRKARKDSAIIRETCRAYWPKETERPTA